MTEFKGVRWSLIEPEQFPTAEGVSFYFDRPNDITQDDFLALAELGDEFYGVYTRKYGYPKSKRGIEQVNRLRIVVRKEESLKSILKRLEKSQKFNVKGTATVEWVQWKLVKRLPLGV